MENLQEQRKVLEQKFSRKQEALCKRYSSSNVNESAYHVSCEELKEVYKELESVVDQLGEHIPVQLW